MAMETFSIICAVIASIAVLGVLFVGLFGMVKGGEFNKQHGNKLMKARVMLQGLALGFLALAYFTAQS